MQTNNNYGFDRFVIGPNGERLRVLMVRSLQPAELRQESNAEFERRMHIMACQANAMEGVLTVEYEVERRNGHAAQCVIHVYTEPRAVAVIEDARPASGRFGTRGARGQRAAA